MIPWAWIFTFTGFNDFYAGFIPKKFIIDHFGTSPLFKIMERQKAAFKIREKQERIGHPDPFNPRALVQFDDYMGKDIKYNDALKRYYMTGRHYAAMTIFMTQYIKETPPVVRSNTDYCVFFNSDHLPSLEVIREEFAGKYDKNCLLAAMIDAFKEPHTFICINNDPNCKEHEKFFIGKADMLDAKVDYIFGCEQYWIDSQEQLREIESGKMQANADLRAELAEYEDAKNTKGIYKETSKSSEFAKLPEIKNQ